MAPLMINKSAKKLNTNNLKYVQRTPLQTSPSFNGILKPKEKYPLDSKKGKNNIKKTQIIIKENKNFLKSSASQKVLNTIKNPFVYINTNNLNQNQNFISQNKYNNNSILHKCINQPNNNIKLEPYGVLNLSEFLLTEQIGKGSYGKIFCVKWKKNNKIYALKKEILSDIETIQ